MHTNFIPIKEKSTFFSFKCHTCVCQFLKTTDSKNLTLLSIMIVYRSKQCHMWRFFENTKTLTCQTRFCAQKLPLVSHMAFFFFAVKFNRGMLNEAPQELISYCFVHVLIPTDFLTWQKLTEQFFKLTSTY